MKKLLLALFLLLTPALAAAESPYQYGTPLQHENLTLVPVYPPKGTPTYNEEYLTFKEAAKEGLIKVTELNGNTSEAQVPAVHVTNKSDKPIFLLAGEVILGGKQDRIISENTIVPPRKKKLRVGVFCVEQGRWDGSKANFAVSGKIGHRKLREKAMFDSDQSAVWAEVAEQSKKSKVAPSTGTYRATLDEKGVQKEAAAYADALVPRLKADKRALGVVVAINGKVRSLDVFANPSLFAKVREQLVHAYALSALSEDEKTNKALSNNDLKDLDRRVAKAQKGKKERRASGGAKNDYYNSPKTKRAVTRSSDGQPVHEFMIVE